MIAALHDALKDSSYRVVAATLGSIAKADSANAGRLLLPFVDVPSHRNIIAASALRALGSVDSLRGVTLALARGRNGQPQELRFASLGILSRYGKGRKDAVHLLESIALEKESFVRGYAIRLLGDFGDPEAIPLLEKIAADTADRSSPQAKTSVEKLRKSAGEKK